MRVGVRGFLTPAKSPALAATRHAHFVMDGSGPVYLTPPSLDTWPDVAWTPDYVKSKKVDLNTLTPAEVANWKPGDTLLLNGKMLTGRDAAHKRIQDMLAKGEALPVDFRGRAIYYVGPVDPVGEEIVGPAGPTTATRMDKFMDMMLEQGLLGCVGKAERGPAATQAIAKHKSAYLMAVGGAAYLVSKAIKTAQVVGFADLGMEAIYEFDVVDMPVTVAVLSYSSRCGYRCASPPRGRSDANTRSPPERYAGITLLNGGCRGTSVITGVWPTPKFVIS